MNEPKVLTRMRLSCCWGDNLNEKELNEVVDYIDYLQNNWNELKKFVNRYYDYYMNNEDFIGGRLCFADIKNKMQEMEQVKDE